MEKFLNKKIAAAALAFSLSLGVCCAPAMASAPMAMPTMAQVAVSDVAPAAESEYVESGIDWTKGSESDVIAIGIGYAPEGVGARGRALARRAAIVDAYRMLAEEIEGIQVDAETTLENMMIKSDVVKVKVSAVIKGAHIVEETRTADGGYCVKVRLPLFGEKDSLASAVIPEATKDIVPAPVPPVNETSTNLTQVQVQQVMAVKYSGVVIDAAGLGLKSTFSPCIMDTNGRVVYGMNNIDKNFAISNGMVEYSTDLQKANGGTTRAGANPLVIKATAVKGGVNSTNPVNVVVSVEDADRILFANQQSQMLSRCAVVFVK